MRLMLILCAALALIVGVSTATAGGGNSDAAKACQQGGWQNLVREDGTGFKNDGDCVSYAAQGGVLQPKPPCTAGSENFAADAEFSQPTSFSGGTIDTSYGPVGGVLVQGSSWNGGYAAGTHVLFTGLNVNSFHLTFTNPVGSVSVDAEANTFGSTTDTLTGFNPINGVVNTASAAHSGQSVATLTVNATDSNNNIKSITVSTDDPANFGVGFTNIVWTCN
jgi:hypothetical protein